MSPYIAAIRSKIGHDLLLVPTVSAAIFDEEGRLLLARHVDGDAWAPVGGIVDPDEAPDVAVRREVGEETGLDIDVLGVIGTYGGPECRMTYDNGDRIAFVATMYACRVIGGRRQLEEAEIDDVRWFHQDEAMRLTRLPWTELSLPDAFDWWAAHGS